MAIRGLSTSFLNSSNSVAKALPSFFFTLIKVGVTLNKTASKMEHIKEKKIETIP